MSRLIVLLLVHACVLVGSLPAQEPPRLEPDAIVSRLAFGSCARQNRPQPIWKTIAATKPQLFVWTGDIIYADTENMDVMRKKWAKLQAIAGYARLRRTTPILATWDDHDYGRNDAGADYARREASQQIFLDAFGVPKDSPRRTRAGVYHAETYGPVGKRLQVILLDTRYHRSPLQRFEGKRSGYRPLGEQHATMLGEDQWAWLEERLREPADLRLIVSSIQFVSEEHRFEKWNNLYRERRRMERLIRTTGARGVVFLSGDRHHAEISRWHRSQGYPLIDITASGMTGGGAKNGLPILRSREANRHRVGPVVFGPHFGQVDIDWERPDPLVTLSIVMQDGSAPLVHRVALSELSGEPRGDAALVDRYRTAGVDPEIVTDGDTADWPAGQNLLVTADHLHFRFRTPTLRSLGTGPRPIEIGFDLDGKSDTGVPAGGVTGADLRLTFSPPSRNGRRQWWPNVERREGADMVPVDAGEIGLFHQPSAASRVFELRIDRNAGALSALGAARAGAKSAGARALAKEQEEALALGEGRVDARAARSSFRKVELPTKAKGTLRIVSLNVLWTGPEKTPEPFARIFRKLDADVYLLQEWASERYRGDELAAWFREHVDPGRSWEAMVTGAGGWSAGTAVVAPHALSARLPSHIPVEGGDWNFPVRLAGAVVDTPTGKLLAGTVHLKAAGGLDTPEDQRRLAEARAVNYVVRGFGAATRPDAVVLGGDFNHLGSPEVLRRAVRGLDTDGSPLTYARPRHLEDPGLVYTWGKKGTKSRLDHIAWSDASAELVRAFVLDTSRMTSGALRQMGLKPEDSHASDHLPLVIDIRMRPLRKP